MTKDVHDMLDHAGELAVVILAADDHQAGSRLPLELTGRQFLQQLLQGLVVLPLISGLAGNHDI
jgi:hypothetical protein